MLWTFCELFHCSIEELERKYRYAELRLMSLASRIQSRKIKIQGKTGASAPKDVAAPKKRWKDMTLAETLAF